MVRNYKVICRNEPYGGIIFNQHTGYSFKVDQELFSTFLSFQKAGEKYPDAKIQATMESMARGCEETLYWERKDFPNFNGLEVTSSPEKVSFSITNYCSKGCEFCYSNATPNGAFFEIEHLPMVVSQLVQNRVLQVTVGGGEPTAHPHLTQILRGIREANMIPNLTTNGLSLTDQILKDLKRYCGAVAFSIDPNHSITLLDWIQKARRLNLPCHLHYIISKKTLPTLDQELEPYLTSGIERLTFLLFKPLGRGANLEALILSKADIPLFRQKLAWLEQAARTHAFQITFGSDFVPFLVQANLKWNPLFSDYCTAARSSCSLDYELNVKPCSLLETPALSLASASLQNIWQSAPFQAFRKNFTRVRTTCAGCASQNICKGGCSVYYDLTPCT